MPQVGCLGDIAFFVSSELVETCSNVKWSGSARYSTHERHLADALTEFCGLDPDEFSFDIVLSSDLGIDPMEELVKIWSYERDGTALPLILGDKAYGKYRWCIISHETAMDKFDARGNLTWATVSISLLEYLEE